MPSKVARLRDALADSRDIRSLCVVKDAHGNVIARIDPITRTRIDAKTGARTVVGPPIGGKVNVRLSPGPRARRAEAEDVNPWWK